MLTLPICGGERRSATTMRRPSSRHEETSMTRTTFIALAALGLSATAALAQTPAASPTAPAGPPPIVRGKITAMSDTQLTVKTDKGPQVVNLAPTWTVAVMKPVAIDAIQPGSFIGTTEMPSKDGSTGKSL